MTTYGITGAAGQLGRLVATDLLAQVPASEIVLTSRNPAALADFAAQGASTRAADFTEPAGLAEAFAGVDTLLIISTDAIGVRLAQQRDAIAAAVKAGVTHLLYTSVPRPVSENPAFVVPDHAGTEAALAQSGVAWTALRNNLYADMQVAAINQAAALGQLLTNVGDGLAAYVTRADCAAAAVGAMLNDSWKNRALDITGPTAYSAEDLAALASQVAGGTVPVVNVADEEYIAALSAAGLPDALAHGLASFGAAIRQGFLADVSNAVPELTGRPAQSLAQLIQPGAV